MQMRAAYTLGGTAHTMHHIAPNLPRAKRANARWTKGLVACAWAERAWWFCIVYTSTAVYSRVYCGCCCCRANQPLSTLRHMCGMHIRQGLRAHSALARVARLVCVRLQDPRCTKIVVIICAPNRPAEHTHTHTQTRTFANWLWLVLHQCNTTTHANYSRIIWACVCTPICTRMCFIHVCLCVHLAWILCEKNLLHLRMPPTAEIIVWLDGARAVETMFVFAIKCHFECGSHSQPRKTLIPPLWLINRTSWKETAVLTTHLQRSPTRDSLTHFAQSTTHTKVKRMRSASLTNAILPALCQALTQTPPKDWYMRRANRLVSLASDRCVLSVNDVCRTLF